MDGDIETGPSPQQPRSTAAKLQTDPGMTSPSSGRGERSTVATELPRLCLPARSKTKDLASVIGQSLTHPLHRRGDNRKKYSHYSQTTVNTYGLPFVEV